MTIFGQKVRRKTMNNCVKFEVGTVSWDDKSQLHNLPMKPVNTQVVHFLFKLGLFKFAKLYSRQHLQGFIEVGTTVKNCSKKLKLGYPCQLAVGIASSHFFKLGCANPPYKYGGKNPNIILWGSPIHDRFYQAIKTRK